MFIKLRETISKTEYMSKRNVFKHYILHLCVFVLSSGCQPDVIQIHNIIALKSPLPFKETISNAVEVLQKEGCLISISNNVIDVQSEKNYRTNIYFESDACTGSVTIEAFSWDIDKGSSVSYKIKKERKGTNKIVIHLSKILDSLGENNEIYAERP